MRRGLEDPSLAVKRPKQTGRIIGSFGRAEKKEASRRQGVMECATHLLLQFTIEIDQQVAAGNEVETRKRRILEQAVHGKQRHIAKLPLDAVVFPFAHEIAV